MRLIVADDSALLREGLAGLLERQGHEVVALAASAPELEAMVHHAMAQNATPDVVITDVRMPPRMAEDGLQAALAIRATYPHIGICVVSQYIAPEYAAELFGSDAAGPSVGGLGYLLKDRIARVADFMRNLAVVAAGGTVIDADVAARLVRRTPGRLAALSPRELEVLELMAQGLSNAQISEQLVLSTGAVAKHVAGIFAKLGLGPGEENRRVRAVLTFLAAAE